MSENSNDETTKETTDVPQPTVPAPGDYPEIPVAPAAIDPIAVENVPVEKKFGWQDEPNRPIPTPQACAHIATVSARTQLVVHDVGHEWICTCGQVFVLTINTGGKKTLTPKEEVR